MQNRFLRDLGLAIACFSLACCQRGPWKAAAPVPEQEQAIGDAAKGLYQAVSKAPPHSAEQQQLVLLMAQSATNGKELLLAMRAGMGVFSASSGSPDRTPETQLSSIIMPKMLKLATLDQLISYANRYGADAQQARPLVERMCELGKNSRDPQVWDRIGAAAARFNLGDLKRLAEVQGQRPTAQ